MKIIGYKVKDIGATVLVNERISVETYNFMDGEFKQYYEPIYQDIQTSDSSVPVAENVEQSITPQPTDDELWGNVFAKIKQYGLNNEVLNELKSKFKITRR